MAALEADHRVIALLGAGADLPAVGPEIHFVRAASGYEAAAELLLAPASAMLVDLSRITPTHVALLDLAARLEVPVVAFGAPAAVIDGAVLAGVRLVPPEQIATALRTMLEEMSAVPEEQALPEEDAAGGITASDEKMTDAPGERNALDSEESVGGGDLPVQDSALDAPGTQEPKAAVAQETAPTGRAFDAGPAEQQKTDTTDKPIVTPQLPPTQEVEPTDDLAEVLDALPADPSELDEPAPAELVEHLHDGDGHVPGHSPAKPSAKSPPMHTSPNGEAARLTPAKSQPAPGPMSRKDLDALLGEAQ